ncbi:type II secretion system protein J [Krasilnikovia sp. MM14-A1004]|uniref:PulJ/GspJ family protein n=1 Tax=Krasilnikovia sp. MM14-A1004 TaxID=3373541 RepID=UPI00399D400B
MRWLRENMSRRRGDEGVSLVEMMVTMSIMSVVGAMFATGIIQVFRANNLIETRAVAQAQLYMAFQRFDRELRYASWIADPGKVGTRWYVEFADADPTKCAQLRFDTTAQPAANGQDGAGILQLVRWTKGTPPTAASTWTTVASNLVEQSYQPFEMQPANSTPYSSASAGSQFTTANQRLRIRLTSRSAGSTTEVDTTFTAVNTSRDTLATNGCSEGRPTI